MNMFSAIDDISYVSSRIILELYIADCMTNNIISVVKVGVLCAVIRHMARLNKKKENPGCMNDET